MKTNKETLKFIIANNSCIGIACRECPLENYCGNRTNNDDAIQLDGISAVPHQVTIEAKKKLYDITFDEEVNGELSD